MPFNEFPNNGKPDGREGCLLGTALGVGSLVLFALIVYAIVKLA